MPVTARLRKSGEQNSRKVAMGGTVLNDIHASRKQPFDSWLPLPAPRVPFSRVEREHLPRPGLLPQTRSAASTHERGNRRRQGTLAQIKQASGCPAFCPGSSVRATARAC